MRTLPHLVLDTEPPGNLENERKQDRKTFGKKIRTPFQRLKHPIPSPFSTWRNFIDPDAICSVPNSHQITAWAESHREGRRERKGTEAPPGPTQRPGPHLNLRAIKGLKGLLPQSYSYPTEVLLLETSPESCLYALAPLSLRLAPAKLLHSLNKGPPSPKYSLPLLPPPPNPPQALCNLTLPSSPAVSNWHPARRKRAAATKPLWAGKAARRAPSCQAHSSTILSSRPTATTRPDALKAKVRTEAPGAPSSYMGR